MAKKREEKEKKTAASLITKQLIKAKNILHDERRRDTEWKVGSDGWKEMSRGLHNTIVGESARLPSSQLVNYLRALLAQLAKEI